MIARKNCVVNTLLADENVKALYVIFILVTISQISHDQWSLF